MDEYRELFVTEANEQLLSLEQNLLRLEKDPTEKEAIHETFRVLHTLKGMSGTLGLTKIQEVAHQAESYLDRLRRGEAKLDRTGADVLLATRDWLGEAAAAVAKRAPEPDGSALVARIQAVLTGGPEVAARAQVRVELAPDARAPGLRILAVLAALGRWGKVISSSPPADAVPDEARALDALVETTLPHQELRRRLADLVDVADASASPPPVTEATGAAGSAAATGGLTKQKQSTIRVSTSQLDDIVDAMGELVLSKARLADLARTRDDPRLTEAVDRLDRLTAGLYENVLKARTLPLETVLARFPRMVRDLARENGKQVELVMRGVDVEMDRSVIEEAGDPLVHLLRNSVDHGLEPPADRVAAGKPPVGVITIEARREHNRVVVDVSDDGRGIDPDKIRAVAVRKGVVTDREAAQLTLAEVYMLLCRPGFSTAEKVTKTSGRGVGMDTVKRWVEDLGGSLRIHSEKGKGTRMSLALPLTLAVLQGLVVRVGAQRYVVPIDQVEATVDLDQAGLQRMHGHEVFRWKEAVAPLVRLSTYFGVEAPREPYAIVISAHGEPGGLAVDEVLGQEELVVKALDRTIVPNREYGGATILGDGSVALILNVSEIAARGAVVG